MRRMAFLVAGALMLGAGVLSAQSAPSAQSPHARQIQQLRARMDSLAPQLDALQIRDSLRADSVTRAGDAEIASTLDSVTVGPFQLIGTKRQVGIAAPYFRDAWQTMRPQFEGMEDDMTGVVFELRYFANRPVTRQNYYFVHAFDEVTAEEARAIAVQALGARLTLRLPESVRGWLTNVTIGYGADLAGVQRQIAFGTSPRTAADTSMDVRRADLRANRCIARVLQDCRNLLALEGPRNQSAHATLRASFLTHVVMNAPAGAVAAFAADTSGTIAAIEHIGAAPIDTLIGRWLDYVDAERPRGFAGAGRANLATLFWIAVFAALAMRSTRWRLG